MSEVAKWDVDEVANFLSGLKLDALVPEFKKNAVDGQDLLELTDDDMTESLQCSALQIRKIRNALSEVAPGIAMPPKPAAAPAPAPAPTPAPAANFAKPAIKPDDLDQYKTLRGRIGELEAEQVEAGAAATQQRLQQTAAERAAEARRVQGAAEAKAKAEKKVAEADDWYPGKLIGGASKREAKKEEKEKALVAATAAAEAEVQRLAAIDAAVKATQGELGALGAKVQELGASRAGLAALLDRVFADPAWAGDPAISSLRAAMADLNAKAAEASGHAATYGQARDRLKASLAKIAQALGALQRTRFMGAMGIGMQIGGPPRRRQPGSMMMDIVEIRMVQQANELVKAAAGDFQAARQILPALPHAQTDGAVRAAQAGVFMNVLAPGLIGDMAQQMAVRKSIAVVEELKGEVARAAEWTQRNLDAFGMDVNRLRGAGAERQSEMVRYQHAQMAEALAAGGK